MLSEDFTVALVTEEGVRTVEANTVASFEEEVTEAWVQVECGECGKDEMALAPEVVSAGKKTAATNHQRECPDCETMIEADITYHQESRHTWQPLQADVQNGEILNPENLEGLVEPYL